MHDTKRILQEAEVCLSKGQYQKAEKLYQKIIELDKNDINPLLGLTNLKVRTKNFSEALSWIEKVLEVNNNYKEAYITKAIILKEMKQYLKAIASLQDYLSLDPNNVQIINQIAFINSFLENFHESIKWLEKAKNLSPNKFETFYMLGYVYEKLLDYKNSILNYKKTIELNPDHIDAYINCANILKKLKQYQDAIFFYEKAIQLNKNFVPALNNLGILFFEIKDFNKAIFFLKKAIEIDNQYAPAYCNLGNVLIFSNKPHEAVSFLEKAYRLDPEQEFLLGMMIFSKLSACDWKDFADISKTIEQSIILKKKTATAYESFVLFDSPKINQVSSNIYKEAISDQAFIIRKYNQITNKTKNKKIKLAYISADYREHPMGYLMSDVIKLHDRKKFEVFGFDLQKPSPNDKMYSFYEKNFDHFINIENLEITEIIELCKKNNIDIAIDLLGHTRYSKPEIFQSRCAPIQINYLGFPGTTGKNYCDYIIVDQHLVDDENKDYFDEQLIFLPNCYQPNNYKVTGSNYNKFERKDFGLPENKFIFCSFNNNHKILPGVFYSWMKIIKSVDQSILWLFVNNDIAKKNILRELEKFSLKQDRVIFCDKVDHETHLSRIKLADLFLDTFPYNAHTTASDAILRNLPVITVAGKSFQSRVAKSILSTINIKELICKNFEEYEQKAIKLAKDKIFYQNIKKKIEKNLLNAPFGNIKLYIQNLESAYTSVYKKHLSNN